MSDTRVVVIAVSELVVLVDAAVRKALDERSDAQAGAASLSEEMTTKEVLRLLKVTSKTLHVWRKTEGFPSPRSFGKNSVRYLRADVEAWRASRTAPGPGTFPARGARDKSTRRPGGTAAH